VPSAAIEANRYMSFNVQY